MERFERFMKLSYNNFHPKRINQILLDFPEKNEQLNFKDNHR